MEAGRVLRGPRKALNLLDQLALGCDDDVDGQGRHAVLLAGRREVVGVDFHRHIVGLQRRDDLRPREDFSIHGSARLAPVRPEMNQHQAIRLDGKLLGTFQGGLPPQGLLAHHVGRQQ